MNRKTGRVNWNACLECVCCHSIWGCSAFLTRGILLSTSKGKFTSQGVGRETEGHLLHCGQMVISTLRRLSCGCCCSRGSDNSRPWQKEVRCPTHHNPWACRRVPRQATRGPPPVIATCHPAESRCPPQRLLVGWGNGGLFAEHL